MKALSDSTLDRLLEDIGQPDLTGTRYSMIRSVAAGGMGKVYLVKDAELDREIALKVMNLPTLDSDEAGELAARILREARIVAKLEHPGIVPVHDVGRLADGRIFFTMKFVEGRDLDEYLAEAPPLSELVRSFLRITEAVAFAHSRGVIHRDLKPDNIMIGPFGEVLVMDWGIAKVLNERSSDPTLPEPNVGISARNSSHELDSGGSLSRQLDPVVTGAGAVLGTPGFMSPEQASGIIDEIGPATDVFGLGAVLYYMLTGHPPQIESEVPKWSGVQRRLPVRLRAMCSKALAANPEDRYCDAEDLSRDVLRFLNGESVSAHKENLAELTVRWASRNRFLIVLIAAYLLMRALVLFFAHR